MSHHAASETLTGLSEEAFIACLGQQPIETKALIAGLEAMRSAGQAEQAESRAELLQDTLVERKALEDALEVMQARVTWAGDVPRAGGSWLQEALDICGNLWDQKALVEESGFDKGIPASESVRRLRLLRSLREGVLCHDRTWGLGVVVRMDCFYKRVEIDFERKLGHQLSLAYAAETLQMVGDDHLLVWKRRRGEELKALVQNKPADVVRMTLRSFGPCTVAQLQAQLCPGIVADADWKRFWDSARKELKRDAQVIVPAARSEPLRMAETEASREAEWFQAMARERDLDKLIDSLEEVAGRSATGLTPAQQGVIRDRLAFAVKGAWSGDYAMLARVTMSAHALAMADVLSPERTQAFYGSDVFVATMRQLSTRHSRAFLKFLGQLDETRTSRLLLRLLPALEIGSLNEAVAYLLESGHEAECGMVFKEAFDNRAPSLEMLSWLGRNMERRASWNLATMGVLAGFMLDVLEQEASGERLKAQNQLRERFGRADWLKELLAQMERRDSEQMLMRIKESPAWPALDRQSIMAQIVKLYPDLAPLLASRSAKAEGATRGPVTSQRSYRERQAQLDRIVKIEIPKVAKDIALARSYGDLRENFEFKAAKEAQTILFHRRDELMRQLRQVTPTDFKDYPTDKAGPATTVMLEYGDGRQERYHILGEWDGDTEQGIISSTSRMAAALLGRKAGEEVTVPSEQGEVKVLLKDVQPVPAEIRAWIDGVGLLPGA